MQNLVLLSNRVPSQNDVDQFHKRSERAAFYRRNLVTGKEQVAQSVQAFKRPRIQLAQTVSRQVETRNARQRTKRPVGDMAQPV